MSKSLGNGIDPLDVIDKYSADALVLPLSQGMLQEMICGFTGRVRQVGTLPIRCGRISFLL